MQSSPIVSSIKNLSICFQLIQRLYNQFLITCTARCEHLILTPSVFRSAFDYLVPTLILIVPRTVHLNLYPGGGGFPSGFLGYPQKPGTFELSIRCPSLTTFTWLPNPLPFPSTYLIQTPNACLSSSTISVRSILHAINCRELRWYCLVRPVGMSLYPNSQMHSKLW